MKNILKKIAGKIANTYRQDGKTFLYHAASVGASTLAGALTANALEGSDPALNSAVTTSVGALSYWTPFIGLTARSERNEMKDESGRYLGKKIASKALQYASFIGIGEALYAGVRGLVQYNLQKHCDLDPSMASTLTDVACATAYGVLVPPVRQGLRSIQLENVVNKVTI